MSDGEDSGKAQGSENIRRVYALPAEMVDRITAYQKDKGLTSEVEAVRRLLDEALKSRDDLETIINRLLANLAQTKIASEAAKEVLVGHPLVKSMSFEDDSVTFTLKNEERAKVTEAGLVTVKTERGGWEYRDTDNPYAGGSLGLPF